VDDDDSGEESEDEGDGAFFDASSRVGSLLSLPQVAQQQQHQQQDMRTPGATANGSRPGSTELEESQAGAEGAVAAEPGPLADSSFLARLGTRLPAVGAFFTSLVPRDVTPAKSEQPSPVATSTPMGDGNGGDDTFLVRRSQRVPKPRKPCK
jgi:hypothetical protein